MLSRIRPYSKALVALGGLLVMAGQAVATGKVNTGKAFDLVAALISAIAVAGVKNAPKRQKPPAPTVADAPNKL